MNTTRIILRKQRRIILRDGGINTKDNSLERQKDKQKRINTKDNSVETQKDGSLKTKYNSMRLKRKDASHDTVKDRPKRIME